MKKCTVNDQILPNTTATPDGGWVTTWTSVSQTGTAYDVYMRQYDSSGNPITGEVMVNTTSTGNQMQEQPSTVAVLKDGSYIITWQSNISETSVTALTTGISHGDWDIYARRFSSTGVPLSGEFRINSNTSGAQKDPAILSLTDGGYVVAWQSWLDGNIYDVYMKRYDQNNNPVGTEFIVNTHRPESQYDPALTQTLDGGVLALWTSYFQDISGGAGGVSGIYGQRFDSNLNPISMILPTKITGGDGDDAIIGDDKNSIIDGGSGNDTLDGGEGADTLIGGLGNDILLSGLTDIVVEV